MYAHMEMTKTKQESSIARGLMTTVKNILNTPEIFWSVIKAAYALRNNKDPSALNFWNLGCPAWNFM